MNNIVIDSRMMGEIAKVINPTLPDRATVFGWRGTPTSNGAGGFLDPPAIASGIACRLEPGYFAGMVTGAEKLSQMSVQMTSNWRLTFPVGTDVQPQDRIVYTKAGATASRSFEVVSPGDPQSFSAETAVIAKEIL